MNCGDIRQGLEIKTAFNLESTAGMMVNPQHLTARKPDTDGVVKGVVPGHGGDVWWVEHKDGSVGAYCFTEFNPKPASEVALNAPMTVSGPLRFRK